VINVNYSPISAKPTGGYYGAALYHFLLERRYSPFADNQALIDFQADFDEQFEAMNAHLSQLDNSRPPYGTPKNCSAGRLTISIRRDKVGPL
jgi:hypothetical protein